MHALGLPIRLPLSRLDWLRHVLFLSMLILGGVFAYWLAFPWGSSAKLLFISNLLFTLPLIPAVILGWLNVLTAPSSEKRSRFWLALAISSYLMATLVWSFLQRAYNAPPFPSWADVFYLSFAPCLGMALINLPQPIFRGRAALRLGLDIAICVVSVGTYSWYFMLAPTILSYAEQPLAMLVALAYPLFDLVMLSLLLLILLRRQNSQGLPPIMLLLGLSLGLMAMADTLYFFGIAQSTYDNGSWYNIVFVGSNLLLAVAPYCQSWPAKIYYPRWLIERINWPLLWLIFPYSAVAASYVLMLSQAAEPGIAYLGVQWATALVTLLVVLRQFIALLENASLNRQLTLSNEALQIEKNRAHAANQAKSTFLANMSHELRTPLNAILGYAQILQQEPNLSERQSRGMSTISSSGQHLLSLINDVLDLAKVESGKLQLRPSPTNLPDFLGLLNELIGIRAQAKNLQFKLSYPPDLPATLLFDCTRLRQVLLNLLGNALKFSEQGEVGLHLQKLAQEPDRISLRFTVSDEGVGIAAEHLQTIFQPFEQVGEQDRRIQGSGLGLAISRQLLQLMGSDMQVNSQVGQGSNFYFDLQLPICQASPLMPSPNILGYHGPRLHILVVDDLSDNRLMLIEALSSLGFIMSDADHGQTAIDLMANNKPDLIIMDRVMPVLDGLSTTRTLRQRSSSASIPIIMASASASADEKEQAYAAGVNAFICKPIAMPALLHSIQQLLALQWIYNVPTEHADISRPPIAPPPPHILEKLHKLALAGNLRALRQQAAQIADEAPIYSPFTQQLNELTSQFRSKAVLNFIEDHLSKASSP